jgi:hypothetical protein
MDSRRLGESDSGGSHRYHGPAAPKKAAKKLARPEGGPYIYRVAILKVVDGDTFDVNIDLGFKAHIEERVRLAAVDASPIGEDGGRIIPVTPYLTQ